MPAPIQVCLSFDFDAMSLWICDFQTDSPNALSRGEFGGRVGAPRLLDLLRERGIRSTWFIPGHTVEAFPESAVASPPRATRSAITATATRTRGGSIGPGSGGDRARHPLHRVDHAA